MGHTNDPAVIERLMRTKGRWAIVGLSTNEWRAAYDTSLFIRDRMGMEIIPVNLPGERIRRSMTAGSFVWPMGSAYAEGTPSA